MFLAETGWRPARTASMAGALLYSSYDFFKRFVKPLIARRDGGGTDTSRDFEYGLGRRRHIRPRLPQ